MKKRTLFEVTFRSSDLFFPALDEQKGKSSDWGMFFSV